MGRKKKTNLDNVDLISKTIIEPGTDKKPVSDEETVNETPIEIVQTTVGNIQDLNTRYAQSTDDIGFISKTVYNLNNPPQNVEMNNFLQTVYDLGYADGKYGNNKRELRIDRETGRLKF